MEVDDESIPPMDHKICSSCRAAHFNEWDLCSYCASLRQQELERRLQEGDRADSLMSIAATALFGNQRQRLQRTWRIG